MNKKEEYWNKNLLHATVVKHGRTFNVFHNMHDKQAKVFETGFHWTCGRRDFRKWVKKYGGTIHESLKTGEYYDIHRQKQALWGINNND